MPSWQVVWFVLWVVSSFTCVVAKVVDWCLDYWALPDFISNEVGGVMAYCSVSDFESAQETTYDGRFTIVRDTVAISRVVPNPMPGRRLGGTRAYVPYAEQHNSSLFVPFASEGYISYEQQGKFFVKVKPENLHVFLLEKVLANRRSDFRRRFTGFMNRNDDLFYGIRVASLCVAIVALMATVLLYVERSDEIRSTAPAVFYTTTPGSNQLVEQRGTQRELQKLPVGEPMVGRLIIVTGPVTDIMSVGGGIGYACVLRKSDDQRICGFAAASLGLKEGSQGYLRPGWVKVWINAVGNDYAHQMRWAISETEALALRDKAGYTFEQ